jgi:hypothetical protein
MSMTSFFPWETFALGIFLYFSGVGEAISLNQGMDGVLDITRMSSHGRLACVVSFLVNCRTDGL